MSKELVMQRISVVLLVFWVYCTSHMSCLPWYLCSNTGMYITFQCSSLHYFIFVMNVWWVTVCMMFGYLYCCG